MIEHFNAHRNEFNELANIYGQYNNMGPGKGYKEFASQKNVKELMTKAEIGWLKIGPGEMWLDDPYSLDSAKQIKAMHESKEHLFSNSRRMIIIQMKDDTKYSAVYPFNGGYNWKDYIYIPVDPEIMQGRIRLPRYISHEQPLLWLRVLESLDSLKWKKGECVLRKIEPKWFLSRCRAN